MGLKENTYYWKYSLKHPESISDKYYTFDKIIVNDKELIKKVEHLRELIISFCVVKNKVAKDEILDEILNVLNSANIQYTEFVSFWATLDFSYSIYKTIPNKKDLLNDILLTYCKRRRKLYDKLGYSNVVIQALFDKGSSRRKSSSANNKLSDIIKIIFNNSIHSIDIESFMKNSVSYIFPDRGGKKVFSDFVKKINLDIRYSKNTQGKIPDLLIKIRNRFFIVEAKHLKESGGEQNKSVDELIDFIKQKENDKRIHYVSFADGIYFNLFNVNLDHKRNRKTINKISIQKENIEKILATNKNNFFVNTAGFISLLNDAK